MPFELRVFDRAEEDLYKLLETVPEERHDAILHAIDGILSEFVGRNRADRPAGLTIPLHFVTDSVRYRWLASWQYSQDERFIVITAFGRDPTVIL